MRRASAASSRARTGVEAAVGCGIEAQRQEIEFDTRERRVEAGELEAEAASRRSAGDNQDQAVGAVLDVVQARQAVGVEPGDECGRAAALRLVRGASAAG